MRRGEVYRLRLRDHGGQALRGDVRFVTSVELLDELEDVLVERFGFERAAARVTRAELEGVADIVVPVAGPTVSRDPDDDIVLATAVAGRVDVIVTGDKDLLVLDTHRGVPIRTPRQLDDSGQEPRP